MSTRRSRAFHTGCCLFLLLSAPSPSAWAADLTLLSTDPDFDHEPAIAVNPFDPDDAVVVWFTGFSTSPEGWWATTPDGWTNKVINSFNSGDVTDPSVAYDRFNDVFWACWLVSSSSIYYSKSDMVFGSRVFQDECQVDNESGDRPWLTVGKRPATLTDSNLYVTWRSGEPGVRDLLFKRSIDEGTDCNGRSWEPELVLSDEYEGRDCSG